MSLLNYTLKKKSCGPANWQLKSKAEAVKDKSDHNDHKVPFFFLRDHPATRLHLIHTQVATALLIHQMHIQF